MFNTTQQLLLFQACSWCLLICFWSQGITWINLRWSQLSTLTIILIVFTIGINTKKTILYLYLCHCRTAKLVLYSEHGHITYSIYISERPYHNLSFLVHDQLVDIWQCCIMLQNCRFDANDSTVRHQTLQEDVTQPT